MSDIVVREFLLMRIQRYGHRAPKLHEPVGLHVLVFDVNYPQTSHAMSAKPKSERNLLHKRAIEVPHLLQLCFKLVALVLDFVPVQLHVCSSCLSLGSTPSESPNFEKLSNNFWNEIMYQKINDRHYVEHIRR